MIFLTTLCWRAWKSIPVKIWILNTKLSLTFSFLRVAKLLFFISETPAKISKDIIELKLFIRLQYCVCIHRRNRNFYRLNPCSSIKMYITKQTKHTSNCLILKFQWKTPGWWRIYLCSRRRWILLFLCAFMCKLQTKRKTSNNKKRQ